MYCARLDHFVRFNDNGTIGKCGHMVDALGFGTWEEMRQSAWLKNIRDEMSQDRWPKECVRCQKTEANRGRSIRIASLERHAVLSRISEDYLILGGVLDNVCNSACQSCNPSLSTKIGSLYNKKYIRIDNQSLFQRVPLDRVLEIDLNGGEPAASSNYQRLLENLPPQVKILRVNTNGSRLLPNLENILKRNVHVIVTLSLDGTGKTHDYVRWPVRWIDYCRVVDQYFEISSRYKNLSLQAWSTIHALNIKDFDNIKRFAQDRGLKHDWAYLEVPPQINIKFSNSYTSPCRDIAPDIIATGEDNQIDIDEFIANQDRLRKINIRDYL